MEREFRRKEMLAGAQFSRIFPRLFSQIFLRNFFLRYFKIIFKISFRYDISIHGVTKAWQEVERELWRIGYV